LTLGSNFYKLPAWVAARSEDFRLGISQAHDPTLGGTRLMVFGVISGFDGFRAIPVAVSRHACRVLATAGVMVLAACATPPGGPGTASQGPSAGAPQAMVTARAKARWDAMVKGDLDTAYGYMSPASRQVTSLEKYKANTRREGFRDAKIDSVACEADSCMVKLSVTYDHPRMKGITTPILESWIIDGGQAWYVYGGR
jgi:hypothetical protein